MPDALRVEHLGASGLRVRWPDGATLCFDPPEPVLDALVLTWSEQERTAGVRGGAAGDVAAHPDLLRWLRRDGTGLGSGEGTGDAIFGAFRLRAMPYTPIPWATPIEALRKTLSGLHSPRLAARRLKYTLRRPSDPPLIVEVEHAGIRVAHMGQAIHRFQRELPALQAHFQGADLVLAGADFDDEAAVGAGLAGFRGRTNVIVDTVGAIRRTLGLPTRSLRVSLATAPPGTRLLEIGEGVDIPVTPR
ncbi:hypothetical protein LBMAG42_44790 [Deltaproteobacteria bacterium]|nr:hypothetical protein LBMAG42_44790 [Deltaproteobacteria bacterium]